MCKLTDNYLFYPMTSEDLEVRPKSYRINMKPRLPRKVTASARINLNRFWNELEEFYDRCGSRKVNNNALMSELPAYTTDTHDHARETAENELNERIEAEWLKQEEKRKEAQHMAEQRERQFIMRNRLQSKDILDEDESDSAFSNESSRTCSPLPDTIWNNVFQLDEEKEFLASKVSLPSPPHPSTLRDLVSMLVRE